MAKIISRRLALKGLGTAMALPWLEGMTPAMEIAKRTAKLKKPPIRTAYIFFPNGAIMPKWTPTGVGKKFKLSQTLQPLQNVKEDLLVLSGLAQDNGRAKGDGAGDHARCSASFLTGAHPYKTAGRDIKLGISADQVAAQSIGHHTKLRSLELGRGQSRNAGQCDSGYSCAYVTNISWANETTPMPKEVNPRAVFDRLFGHGNRKDQSSSAAKRDIYNQSILDMVSEDTKRLKRNLGKGDHHKLDEYFTSIREIERRLSIVDVQGAKNAIRPSGIPDNFKDHVQLMMDMMVLAFQTDSTRVCSFMLGRAGSGRSFPEIGARGSHHELSHHQNNKEKIATLEKIDKYSVEQFAYFVEKMKSIREGEGTLLDNSMLMYGSGIADANRHSHHDLPVILAGKGGGKFQTGQHLRYEKNTPLNNLFITMLQTAGVKTETLGDSNGKLTNFLNS